MSLENNASEFLTLDEAASLAGLSHWTIRLWVRKARLTKFKRCSRTVVSRLELLALIEPREIEAGNGR